MGDTEMAPTDTSSPRMTSVRMSLLPDAQGDTGAEEDDKMPGREGASLLRWKKAVRRNTMVMALRAPSAQCPLPLDLDNFTQVRRKTLRLRQSTLQSQQSHGTSDTAPAPELQRLSTIPSSIQLDANIDRGWAWVVMVTSFLMIAVVDGIAFSAGVLVPQLLQAFGASDTKTALVASVLNGFYLGAGPIASCLAEKYGYRAVVVSGSFLAAAAFLAGSWAPNLDLLILLYSAIGGVGFCFVYVTSMVMTSLYFEKRRPLAVGVASCGSGVGIFIFPLIMEKLLEVVSWRWCIVVQSGCLSVCALCGMAFRPLGTADDAPQEDEKSFKEQLMSLIDISLFKSSVFILLIAMAIFATFGISTPFFFIKLLAEQRGVQEVQSSLLISLMGATNTVGRLLVGALLFCCPFNINPLLLLAGGCFLGGVLTTLNVLYTDFPSLAAYALLFGNVYALDDALSTEILVLTQGRQRLSGAFGLICLSRGLSIAAAGPIAGSIYDASGVYDNTFYAAGSALILTGILGVCAWAVHRRQTAKKDTKRSPGTDKP